ncbi:hypothetical protein Ait01nite_067470 [Actinoplanes italicus]|uniref:DUF1877 family protein n=1 Tax=Actinoplanes italicus TaxID=113567 RepID=A0A2T0K156_9ACTN|nr:hypothetical protein [Actinoplanes italicus]PRX16496.1 hypothetical protein CLV67_11977 [Actinoplanes italicus]GIE33702.1 hypothetical protein Ait01nite_067470 [Actinoplanes italicus]
MSAIASLHIVKAADLPEIVGAAGEGLAYEAIDRVGRANGDDYAWSGHVMLNVLTSLDELDIMLASPSLQEASDAINADYDGVTLIDSSAKAFLDRLEPAAYRPADLVDLAELGLDDEETGYAMEDTLTLLRDTIAGLADDEVLLLHIG